VRAREENRHIAYDIIDGYHRSSVLRKLKFGLAKAIVSYGMSDEELYDQRVIAANSVASIQFARVVRAMQRSFVESKWHRNYHLKLSSVLGMAMNEKKLKEPGKNMKLTTGEAQEAIEWALYKVALWQGELGSIYQEIRAAESSFEEILVQVRSTGGGKPGSGVLSPAKFIAMTEELPNNIHLQRKMVAIIREHNPDATTTRQIAQALRLNSKIPSNVKMLEQNPIAVAEELIGDRLDEQPAQNHPQKKGFMRGGEATSRAKADSRENPSVLAQKGAVVFERTQTAGLEWLDYVPSISKEEKQVMKSLFVEGQTPEDVCASLRITGNKLEQLIFSAQRKFALARLDSQLMKRLRMMGGKR